MHILVTGGGGFIGRHLVRRLVARGDAVTVLDAASPASPAGPAPDAASPVTVLTGDVRDPAVLRPALRGQDAVFHLAAVVGVPHAMAREWDSLTTNILGAMHLLNETRAAAIPVFMASSSAIYGKCDTVPQREDDDIRIGNTHRPAWTYSYAKLTEELLGRAAAREWGAPVKIGRLFNVIGPGQTGDHGAAVPRFIAAALRGLPLCVYGDGTQTRTFLDVDDAVEGMLCVFERGVPGEVYNIGGDTEMRVLDVARRIVALAGSTSTIHLIPFAQAFDARFEETPRRCPSTERLRALGWTPRFHVDESLARIVAATRGT